jgi:hypothetical protein
MFFRACLLKLKVSCQFNLVEIDLAHKASAKGQLRATPSSVSVEREVPRAQFASAPTILALAQC